MKINVAQIILDAHKRPVKEKNSNGEDVDVSLKGILNLALANGHEPNEVVGPSDLVKQLKLSKVLVDSDEVDLKSDEIVLLKKLLARLPVNLKGFNRMVVAEAISLLEPEEKKD